MKVSTKRMGTTSISILMPSGKVHRYKRPFDMVGATVLSIVFAPIAVVVALLVRLSSPGPVLFRQERVGLQGRRFVMYKFRTMYHGADESVHREYFARYREGQPAPDQDESIFKLRRDPRITPFGGFLRRFALDEIPQLLNVFKGEMSLVGPRPPIPYEVELYGEHDLGRLGAKPGLTGLWQVKARDNVDFATMVALDLDYIRRQSLHLDLGIVLATIPTLIWAVTKR